MIYNNSLTKKRDQSYKLQKILTNIHFNNVSDKLLEKDWQYKETKLRYSTLTQKKYHNGTT